MPAIDRTERPITKFNVQIKPQFTRSLQAATVQLALQRRLLSLQLVRHTYVDADSPRRLRSPTQHPQIKLCCCRGLADAA